MVSPVNDDDEIIKQIYVELVQEILEESVRRLLSEDEEVDQKHPDQM